MAIAAATGRVGYVYLVDGKLRDWGISRAASASPRRASAQATRWIALLKPEVVVTERIDGSRKGARTRKVIAAIAKAAAGQPLFDVSVPRSHAFGNKYDEAESLVKRFPELAVRLPKRRRIWDAEPRSTLFFEALSLAVPVIDGTAPGAPKPKPRK